MPVIEMQIADRRNPASVALSNRGHNVYSQFGEDGVLEALFESIGATNHWCVEFGAWDGVHLSNTCNLIRHGGWSGVQIEASQSKFSRLQANFSGNTNVRQICATIGFEGGVNSLDDALASTDCPRDFDLLSIDVDGNDWHVWNSVEAYRPRAVIIEYNPSIPNDVIFIQDRDMEINEGSSLAALIRLGKTKGYELAACTQCNAVFVTETDYPLLEIPDNSVDAMRINPVGRIFYGFNGTIYNTLPTLNWRLKGLPIRPDSLQLLSPDERGFGGRVRDGATSR